MKFNEEIKIEQQETEKKHELPEGNIVACGEDSEIRKKKIEYFAGLKEEGVDWPVEIQGGGHSDFKKKEFKVWYPEGDIFLSFAITIHETGHLRQGEIDERFAYEKLGAPNPKPDDDGKNYPTEKDAWIRGYERAQKYCPEALLEIEKKFQEYKNKGKFEEYENFEEYFSYAVRVGLRITEISDKVELPEENDEIKKGRLIGGMIKKDKLTNKFFTNQEAWRAGEKIDRAFAESFIKKMAVSIAEEKY